MKDPRGHGSNRRGVAGPALIGTTTTHYADNGQTIHRVHYSNGSVTESPAMGGHMQALFARARSEGAPHDTIGDPNNAAAAALSSGPKSAAAPVHDSMVERAKGQSDASYIAQRLTANADKTVGVPRNAGESNASYIRRRISD